MGFFLLEISIIFRVMKGIHGWSPDFSTSKCEKNSKQQQDKCQLFMSALPQRF